MDVTQIFIMGQPRAWPVDDPTLREEWGLVWDQIDGGAESCSLSAALVSALYNEVVIQHSERLRADDRLRRLSYATPYERSVAMAEEARALAIMSKVESASERMREALRELDSAEARGLAVFSDRLARAS